jgi:hypothetical protein
MRWFFQTAALFSTTGLSGAANVSRAKESSAQPDYRLGSIFRIA